MSQFTDEETEAARVLFARPATFIMGCAKIEQLPDPDLPEVAFAGRSNVGKSSLINGLVGMHKLARASNEPGRTREVNFFDLDGKMRLVDLPGYGWAKASKGEVKRFQNLGRDYLRGRVTLKRVYLLIDSRHGLKKVDDEALDAGARAMIDQALSCSAVGSPETVKAQLDAFIERHKPDELMVTSQIFNHAARVKSYALLAEAAGR